jgi:hypothetical protein
MGVPEHLPFMQVSPPGQIIPQDPQFLTSDSISVQRPSQQVWLLLQLFPQVPQWLALFARSVQNVEPIHKHRLCPDGQEIHRPFSQSSLGAQTLPHPPQACAFDTVLVHRSLHRSLPAGQVRQVPW